MKIKKVAIIGAGIMGNQIAMQAAISGYNVACYSRRQTTVDNAVEFSQGWFKKQVDKNKMTVEKANEIQRRLIFTNDLKEASANADFVIEAVADVLETKKKIFAEIDSYTPEHTIYASNSSYIVSSKFCNAVKHPENVINLHFFNPALIMKVVEVVKGEHVSAETAEAAYDFVKSINKTPVVVEKEIYGFIVNRIFSALTKEACYLVDMGVATPEDIDIAVKGGLGHPMGPLELLDMTGIDLEYDVYTEKFKNTGDMNDRPATCIVEHYAKKEFGRKSGIGFYDYDKK